MPNEIEDFGGGVAISVQIIRENLNVDGCIENDIRFRIVKDDAQCYDVIVCINFTDLPKFAYYRNDDQFNCIKRKDFVQVKLGGRETYLPLQNNSDTKVDGLVVDYLKLNKNTIRMHFPLPNLDVSSEDLQGATIPRDTRYATSALGDYSHLSKLFEINPLGTPPRLQD